MENEIRLEALKQLTIGEILVLESQQKGVHDIIQNMKERIKFIDKEIGLKYGSFAEDLVNGI